MKIGLLVWLLWQLKVSILMEKTEKWHLLPNSWRYFDQNFIEMFLLFMKTSLSVKLLWPTFTFHVLIMGKIEKFQLVTDHCRYFDKQNDPLFHTTEGIHTKFCIKTEETIIILVVTKVPTAGYGLGQKCKLWGMIKYTNFYEKHVQGHVCSSPKPYTCGKNHAFR